MRGQCGDRRDRPSSSRRHTTPVPAGRRYRRENRVRFGSFFDHDAFVLNPEWAGCYCLEPDVAVQDAREETDVSPPHPSTATGSPPPSCTGSSPTPQSVRWVGSRPTPSPGTGKVMAATSEVPARWTTNAPSKRSGPVRETPSRVAPSELAGPAIIWTAVPSPAAGSTTRPVRPPAGVPKLRS